MEEFNAFVGGVSGVFKGLKASKSKGIHNVKNLQKLKEITQRNEVTVLNWADKLESEILIGYGNQLVKIFDLNTNCFVYSKEKKVGDGPIRGIFKSNGSLVTAVESGVVKLWSESETEEDTIIETGGPISRMRQNPQEENIFGTGGKENDLKLWDLETSKIVFNAKNVRHDELELRVPVWVMDLAFVPDSKQVAVATRYGHVRLYDPSTPTRRPVCQITVKDQSLTCIAVAPKERHVVVGCTTGNMYLVDLRGKGLLLNKYKGFMGSVRQVACPTSEPYVASVSLDRHLRIHHLDTKKLLYREYMQSRLSAILLKSTFTMEDIKEEQDMKDGEESTNIEEIKDKDTDEEYEQMFNEMEVVTENKVTVKKSLKSKMKKKKTKTDFESKEENEERLSDHSEVMQDENHTPEKRTMTRSKTKAKRLKRNDPDLIVVN